MIIWKKKSKILIINRYVTKTNYGRLRKALGYIKNNLIDSDSNMYWIVDSLKNK